jgi:hypothetical protein
MKPTPDEVQNSIIEVLKLTHPTKQTHADVADRLNRLADTHRIAMNMDALAKRGVLQIDPIGSNVSNTKRYGLRPGRKGSRGVT